MSLTHMTASEYHATVNALNLVLSKQGEILQGLSDLHDYFGGLTEAQQNAFLNAEYKHDEAAKALGRLGVLTVSWETYSRMHEK